MDNYDNYPLTDLLALLAFEWFMEWQREMSQAVDCRANKIQDPPDYEIDAIGQLLVKPAKALSCSWKTSGLIVLLILECRDKDFSFSYASTIYATSIFYNIIRQYNIIQIDLIIISIDRIIKKNCQDLESPLDCER